MKPLRSSKHPPERSLDRKRPPLHKLGSSRTTSNRPLSSRGRSPDIKHKKMTHSSRLPTSSRRSTSPYLHSRPSPDSPIDSSKYIKKRRLYSRSPPSLPSPPGRFPGPIRKPLTPPPSHSERVPRNGRMLLPDFDGPIKKMRREPPRIPSHRPPEKLHTRPISSPTSRVVPPLHGYVPDRSREYPPLDSSSHSTYPSGHSRERYRVGSSERSRPRTVTESSYSRSREDYISMRGSHHSLTLDERFRSFNSETSRAHEPRIQFTRAELENITIDVKRGAREASPTVRAILNPANVKLVRQPSEGRRPIFDREEIKHCQCDMREDRYNEQKFAGRHFGLNYGDVDNFEITRHKFDTYRGPPLPPVEPLSEKWRRNIETRKSSPSLERGEPRGYSHQSRSPPPYSERRHPEDRDYRAEKYPSSSDHRIRPDYSESRRLLPHDPSDLRHSLAVKKKESSLHDARHRLMERRESSHDRPVEYRHHFSGSSRRPPENSERMRERDSSPHHRIDYIKSRRESPYEREHPSERGHSKSEEYKSERYRHHSYSAKPESPPRSSSFYPHESRDSLSSSMRSRSFRGFRTRSSRGRSFRGGTTRGSGYRGRGSFRGALSPRGRGAPRRGRRLSPNLWEHDMFHKTTQDH